MLGTMFMKSVVGREISKFEIIGDTYIMHTHARDNAPYMEYEPATFRVEFLNRFKSSIPVYIRRISPSYRIVAVVGERDWKDWYLGEETHLYLLKNNETIFDDTSKHYQLDIFEQYLLTNPDEEIGNKNAWDVCRNIAKCWDVSIDIDEIIYFMEYIKIPYIPENTKDLVDFIYFNKDSIQ